MRTKNNHASITVLDNGVPVVHISCPRSRVAYFGVIVKAGSRNEQEKDYGLAHFVEHTIFKGTQRRKVYHIINRMEAVGGELNAYTTKEETVVYSVFPTGNLHRASNLIADLVANSVFPSTELDKERQVVADEIDSYLDSPSEAIYDDFEDLIFKGSQLGHNILGSVESLGRFDSAVCTRFLNDYYCCDNMVAFYSGAQSAEVVKKILDMEFELLSNRSSVTFNSVVPSSIPCFDINRTIPSHQAHCVMGSRIAGYLDLKEAATYSLLANILGGPGMNSLLNIDIRERRGLAYTVEANTALFSDCGLLTIYFGCDPEDSRECNKRVRETISKFDRVITPRKFEAAKRQYLGQMILASENRESTALGAARSMLWRGFISDSDKIAEYVSNINRDYIIECAKHVGQTLSSLTFSPS